MLTIILVLIRLAITGILIYGAYYETGPYTTILLILASFTFEVQAFDTRRNTEDIDRHFLN